MLLLAIAPGNCLVQEFSCSRRNINEDHRKALILVSLYQRPVHLSLCKLREQTLFPSEGVIA